MYLTAVNVKHARKNTRKDAKGVAGKRDDN